MLPTHCVRLDTLKHSTLKQNVAGRTLVGLRYWNQVRVLRAPLLLQTAYFRRQLT